MLFETNELGFGAFLRRARLDQGDATRLRVRFSRDACGRLSTNFTLQSFNRRSLFRARFGGGKRLLLCRLGGFFIRSDPFLLCGFFIRSDPFRLCGLFRFDSLRLFPLFSPDALCL